MKEMNWLEAGKETWPKCEHRGCSGGLTYLSLAFCANSVCEWKLAICHIPTNFPTCVNNRKVENIEGVRGNGELLARRCLQVETKQNMAKLQTATKYLWIFVPDLRASVFSSFILHTFESFELVHLPFSLSLIFTYWLRSEVFFNK